MSDIREHLNRLPKPDPTGPDRVWLRYERTRQRDRLVRWWPAVPVALAAAAAALLLLGSPEDPREMKLMADVTESLHWSEQVQLEFSGRGSVAGTAKDVSIDWEVVVSSGHPTSRTLRLPSKTIKV